MVKVPDFVEVVRTPTGTLWRLPTLEDRKRTKAKFIQFVLWGICTFVFFSVTIVFSILMKPQDLVYIIPVWVFIPCVVIIYIHQVIDYFREPYVAVCFLQDHIALIRRKGILKITRRYRKSNIFGIKVGRFKDDPLQDYLYRKANEKKENGDILYFRKDNPKWIVVLEGYTREILIPLAETIADACSRDPAFILQQGGLTRPEIEIKPVLSVRTEENVFEKPVGSQIEIRDEESHVMIRLPRKRFRVNPKKLLDTIGFVFVATFIFFGVMSGFFQEGLLEKVGTLIIGLVIFGSIGLCWLLPAVHRAVCEEIVTISEKKLIFSQISFVRKKKKHWNLSAIEEIYYAPGITGSKGMPALTVQMALRNGKNIHLLEDRSDEETMWLAQELRRAVEKFQI